VVLLESAKLAPEVTGAEIETVGANVWLLVPPKDQVIEPAVVLVTTTVLVLLLLITEVAPGLAPNTLQVVVTPHVLLMASMRLVASLAVVETRTMHPVVAVGVNALQVVVVHVYVTPSMTVVLAEAGSLANKSVPTPVAVKVTPLTTT